MSPLDLREKRKNVKTVKIYNLSHRELSPHYSSLLSRGLTFAPTTQPNPFTLFKNLNKFIRDLTVQRFYNIQALKNLPSVNDSLDCPSSVTNTLDQA